MIRFGQRLDKCTTNQNFLNHNKIMVLSSGGEIKLFKALSYY